MHDELFEKLDIVARYRAGPDVEARERFLRQASAEGHSRSTLKRIAWALLFVFGDARSRQNAQGVRGLVPKAECHGVLALAVASQICGAGLHNSTEHRSGTGSAPHIGLRHIPLRPGRLL